MKLNKKLAALLAASAIAASVLGSAQAAQADEMVGETITISPTSGNVNTDTVFLDSIQTTTGAPAGYRAVSGTFAFQNGINMGSVANARTPAVTLYGDTGLSGEPVNMDREISPTNNYVSNKLLNATSTPLQTGAFELRVYFFALPQNLDYVTDKYISLDMYYDATTGAWSTGTSTGPETIETTVSLSATASGNTVTLSATVKADGATATEAAGDIVFKEGSDTIATVAVDNGLATSQIADVSDGPHSYTAEFVPSDAVYGGSTSTASAVQVGGIQQAVDITVSIVDSIGALTLTGVSESVDLGQAALVGGVLEADGTLSAVVTDSRQLDFPEWSLTGQVGDFTDGSKTLDGRYLGWTPSVSGASTSSAGAVVVGGTGNGLKSISELASGEPTEGQLVTNASAQLLLKAPVNTPAGSYSATLTLTLI